MARPAALLLVLLLGGAGACAQASGPLPSPASRAQPDAAIAPGTGPTGSSGTSPNAPPGPSSAQAMPAGELVPLDAGAGLCGVRDGALDRVAERLVLDRVADAPVPSGRQLDIMLREVGSAHVWPAAWGMGPVADPRVAQARLAEWAARQAPEGQPRCGVALWRAREGGWYAAAVRVDALAQLTRLPSLVRPLQWVELDATALVPIGDVHVVLLGPRGRPRRVLASFDGSVVRSRFTLELPGRWLVQLIGGTDRGPLPLLESSIEVEGHGSEVAAADPPGLREAVGARGCPTLDGRQGASERGQSRGDAPVPEACADAIGRMLNAARKIEGAAPLARDPLLAQLAADHAQSMARRRRLGHDVGDGSPIERALEAGVRARVVGENAASARSVQDVHRALWASPAHRENMLDDRYGRLGVGVAFDDRGMMWVAELLAD